MFTLLVTVNIRKPLARVWKQLDGELEQLNMFKQMETVSGWCPIWKQL